MSEDFLVNHSLFATLNSIQISALISNARFRRLTKGAELYHADYPNQLYILKSGTLKISELDQNGDEYAKEVLWRGELFGGLPHTTTMRIDEYAQVISPLVEIYQIPAPFLESLFKENYSFTQHFMTEIASRVEKLEARYRSLVRLSDAKTRLIYLIKEWAQKQGSWSKEQILVENYLTHQDMASLICTTRVTVTNILNELRQQEIIKYNKQSIELLCPHVFGKRAPLRAAS